MSYLLIGLILFAAIVVVYGIILLYGKEHYILRAGSMVFPPNTVYSAG